MNNSIIVIPARYESTRFPGKPLIDLAGKSMIQRVFEQCVKAFPPEKIVVATDDNRIADHCKKLNINSIMTSSSCLTGTDRIAEVSEIIEADYYINVQGDEPVFNPDDISLMLNKIADFPGEILNGYAPIFSEQDFRSTSVPKVVFRPDGRMLYMSRSGIPGNKKGEFKFSHRQVCIYAFPKAALIAFKKLRGKTPLEAEEDIEILRFLEMGYEVRMIPMSADSIPIDNPEDVQKVLKKIKNGNI
jgi:3-deoxy-manno-octulosonate cytidylyltransferase (CMP-KDO synthetase)